jgi:hypothetical protein
VPACSELPPRLQCLEKTSNKRHHPVQASSFLPASPVTYYTAGRNSLTPQSCFEVRDVGDMGRSDGNPRPSRPILLERRKVLMLLPCQSNPACPAFPAGANKSGCASPPPDSRSIPHFPVVPCLCIVDCLRLTYVQRVSWVSGCGCC